MGDTKVNQYTCLTCRVYFRDGNLQRDHYKSDWHRYNLKRKVIELEPVTIENFNERLKFQQAKKDEDLQDTSQYCSACHKNYGNAKAFTNHLSSKKHLNSVTRISASNHNNEGLIADKDPISKLVSSVQSNLNIQQGTIDIPKENCTRNNTESKLNCKKAESIGKTKAIEEENDFEDEEWEEVEGEPIPTTRCLFCSKDFPTFDANLDHMTVQHSFFIPDIEYCTNVEGLVEYLGEKIGEGFMCLWCNEKGKQYFDLLAVQQHMRDKGHCKMLHEGDAIFEYTDFYDYSSSYPDGVKTNPDEAYQLETLQFNDSMQLVLPSGVILGHRLLKIYYKQYIRPGSQLVSTSSVKKKQLLSKYKAIGYGNVSLSEAQKKYKDQKAFKHFRDKYHMKLGVKGNKTTQHHFRNQVMF